MYAYLASQRKKGKHTHTREFSAYLFFVLCSSFLCFLITHTCLTLLTSAGFVVVVSISESKKLSHTPALSLSIRCAKNNNIKLKFALLSHWLPHSLSVRCAKTTAANFNWSSLCFLSHCQFALCTELHLKFALFVYPCACVSPSILLLLNLAPARLSLFLSLSLHSAKNSCQKLFIIYICKCGKGKERETRNERKWDIVFIVNKRWVRVNVFSLVQCMSNCRLAAQTVRNTLEIYYSHNGNSFSCESFIQPAT